MPSRVVQDSFFYFQRPVIFTRVEYDSILNHVWICALSPQSSAATWLVAVIWTTFFFGFDHTTTMDFSCWKNRISSVFLSDTQQGRANGNFLGPGSLWLFSGPHCYRATHLNGCTFVSSHFRNPIFFSWNIGGWTGNTNGSELFAVVALIITS